MRPRVWSVITLLLISLTLVTCSPDSKTVETPKPTTTSASPVVVTPTSPSNVSSTHAQRRTDCPIKVFSSKNPELTCAVVSGFKKGGIRIGSNNITEQKTLLFSTEKLQTTTSKAELVFDTLDMAKASADSTFYFEEGLGAKELKRAGLKPEKGRFYLDLGRILISDASYSKLDSGNRGGNQISNNNSNVSILGASTGEMDIASIGAVYVVQRDKQQQRTQVFNLSNEVIKVADNKKEIRTLGQYQTIAATKDGFDGGAYEFPLCSFYSENEQLLEGLRPREEDFIKGKPKTVQLAYDTARSKTLPAYHELCQLRCPPRSVY